MAFLQIWLIGGLAVLGVMTGLWLVSLLLRDASIVDSFWGMGFVLAAGGWWTVLSPLLMTFLLMRVSGVRLLENNLKATKPGYEEYVRRTSAFFSRAPGGK